MSLSVLHVEDEVEFAEVVAAFLKRDIAEVDLHHATTPHGGLAVLDEHSIDCVVSDYDMPGTNGIEFLESVREFYPDLPFILYTGKGSEEVASDAISAGVTDYLQKSGGSSQYAILTNRIRNAVEQYQAKQTAEATQERLSLFFEQAPLGVIEWNERFEFVQLNETAEDILGYAEDELAGKSWEVIVPETDSEPVGAVVDDLLAGAGGYTSVNRNRRKDGTVIHCEWHNRIVEEAGETVAIFSQFRDISDRIDREQELQLKDRAMDEAPVGISITDSVKEDNPLVYVNEQFTSLTGYGEEEILGKNCRFLQGDATDEGSRESMRQAIDAGTAHSVEILNYRADGSEFWNRVSIAPVRNDDGSIVNFVGFQQDITELKQQELELQTTIENLPGYVYRHENSEEYPLEFVKGDAESITGYTSEELENEVELAESVIHPDDQETVWNELVEGVESSGEFDTRYRIITKNGTHRWIRDQGQVITDPVTGEEFIDGFVTDITELQEREERLERFASIVSHDLRNPLSVAQGRVALAQDEGGSSHLEVVQSAHDRMETLIDTLLNLVREGAAHTTHEEVELESVLMSAWSNVETVEASLHSPTDTSILCDGNRLKQLLENCIRNAVEHGGDDVTVTVERLPDGFAIEDDGTGIDPAIRDSIFEPGVSSDPSGIGFGLSIVEQIVREHGWKIDVRQADLGGARFEITGVQFQ